MAPRGTPPPVRAVADVNTRARLCAHDPALALLLRHVYGDGAWRFVACAPDTTRERWRRQQMGAVARAADERCPKPSAGGK